MSDNFFYQGLKVLDVSSWIAAPACAGIFADMGADVIKVEQPQVGDGYRNYYALAPSPNTEINYTWELDNKSKRSITLNLKTEQGIAVLHELVRQCDVYITNQPLPLRREIGLTYEELQPLNERMIYASLTAYGEEGPDRDQEGFDLVAYWSRSGLMNQMRHGDDEPRQAMAGMGDHPTAVALYASIVTALLKLERTGKGSKVHTSLLANGIWSGSCFGQAAFTEADWSQIPGQRITTALYQAADGRWIQFSMIRSEEDFDRLIMAMDQLAWLTDERFSSMETRVGNAQALTQLMRDVIAQRTSAEWMEIFLAHDIPAARVAQFHDLPTDPQVLANNMAIEPEESVGMPRLIRDPINVDGIERQVAKPAPAMGQHTDQVLAELGYSDKDIATLRDQGII